MIKVNLRKLKSLTERAYKNNYIYKTIYNKNFKLINDYKTLLATKPRMKVDREKKRRIRARKARALNKRMEEMERYVKLKPKEKCNTIKCIKESNNLLAIKRKLRGRRIIKKDRGIVIQKPVIKITKSDLDREVKYFLDNKELTTVNRYFFNFLKDAHKAIYSDPRNRSASIQVQYLTGSDNKYITKFNDKTGKFELHLVKSGFTKINFTTSKPFLRNTDVDKMGFALPGSATGLRSLFIGYRILILTRANAGLTDNNVRMLKAYKPSSDRKYHEMTTASTPLNRLCIYYSFLDIAGIRSLKYQRRNKKNEEKVKLMLKNEGKEIEGSVKKGLLVKSLELLTKKYDNEIFIIFYGSLIYKDPKVGYSINGDLPIYVSKGQVCKISKEVIEKFVGKKCMLYEKNVHVAPFMFNINTKKAVDKVLNKARKGFVLRKELLKGKSKPICGILGYDTETYLDSNDNSIVFCICVYGELNNKNIEKSFYGKDCVDNFIDWIDDIKTYVNNVKSRPKNEIPNILIYGFNNSNFDNIFIYDKLYEKDPATRYIFAGNSIKYMKYNNVTFYDISLFYKLGSLRKTAKAFEFEEEKGYYPYEFPNKDNLNYYGEVPTLKYWNSQKDLDKYKEQEGETFDMKKYTIKYCVLDSKLVYQMAKLHVKEARGMINGRKFDVTMAPTAANLAIKMFKQCFLKDNLYQSPDNIIDIERASYKGGRTEPFKKKFDSKGDERLYYVDINSSYPSGMTEMMPFKYLNSVHMDPEENIECEDVVDYNLYICKSVYSGNDKRVIPNLLIRDEKTNNIVSSLNTDFAPHWGKEVKESIKNGFNVYGKMAIVYEGKEIFKDYSNFFYNERLKIKHTNKSKSLFYKLVMNSLYGKFGQKVFNKTKLIKDTNELYKLLDGDMNKLVDFKIVKDRLLVEYKNPDDQYYSIGKLVRFASYISCTSRCKLSEIMRDVGHENVYYCDTDSIFTSKYPNTRFIDQKILGKWKDECSPITRALFLAPKLYYYETEKGKIDKKAKGVRSKSLSVNDYYDMSKNDNHLVSKSRKMFFRTLDNVKIRDQERSISTVYNKRIWNKNESYPFKNINAWRNKVN